MVLQEMIRENIQQAPCSRNPEDKQIAVQDIASRLSRAGITSPDVNAEIMLTHLLGLRVVDLYTDKVILSPEDYNSLQDMITRRINGEPLQYITGNVNFYGHDIIVRKGVFIPRPETEVLVEIVVEHARRIINAMPQGKDRLRILDLCTGSGNIAISLTKILAECKIISSDISDIALNIAKENAAKHSVSDRIEFVKADLFSLPEKYKAGFDIIVCNPPYITYCDIEHLSKEISQEPMQALAGGEDGMDFYRRIIKYSPGFLKNNGMIILEIGDNNNLGIEEVIRHSDTFSEIEFSDDLNGIRRVVAARLKS
jgi:release factor glutamine methyltransferase